MSFRDLSSRSKPQGLELEGESNNKGVYSPSPSPQSQRHAQLKKNSLRRTASNNTRPTAAHQLDRLKYSRSKSDFTYQNYHQSTSYANDHTVNNNGAQQSLLVQQREEEYAMQVMQQREDELRDIHRKMNVVNEIYQDLGEVVDQQQEQIDQVEDEFGGAAEATRRGLEQLEKANKKHDSRRKLNEPEAEQGGSNKRKQFFYYQKMHGYLSRSASEIAKLVSKIDCGGSSSADYVDSESWKK
mmetsp:Transcript_21452/g.46601  ORF Transcript_21452/g.46601 Transcript_21452/m.46601 type:complete len:242 (+) Transcript_21452:124-849(+)|eukprot:CAMPEP_0172319054 /NCGR_PEP_ID=MMETSP1058-20130122/36636_1 /TAXON_ID=83371 /ORGANISM="Detonula confervacea, Strain CCMP 353" /LENGTH=241 /DNA_ID=CAMNT_0013033999 /DNA_START=51 /DNA_END=776 /DNA_ORIENTATION=+